MQRTGSNLDLESTRVRTRVFISSSVVVEDFPVLDLVWRRKRSSLHVACMEYDEGDDAKEVPRAGRTVKGRRRDDGWRNPGEATVVDAKDGERGAGARKAAAGVIAAAAIAAMIMISFLLLLDGA